MIRAEHLKLGSTGLFGRTTGQFFIYYSGAAFRFDLEFSFRFFPSGLKSIPFPLKSAILKCRETSDWTRSLSLHLIIILPLPFFAIQKTAAAFSTLYNHCFSAYVSSDETLMVPK